MSLAFSAGPLTAHPRDGGITNCRSLSNQPYSQAGAMPQGPAPPLMSLPYFPAYLPTRHEYPGGAGTRPSSPLALSLFHNIWRVVVGVPGLDDLSTAAQRVRDGNLMRFIVLPVPVLEIQLRTHNEIRTDCRPDFPFV
jgi:hypothetical protein